MGVNAFAAQFAVERLDQRIIGGLAWTREVERHLPLVSPQIYISRDQLAAIVDPGRLGIPDLATGPIERSDHVLTPVPAPRIDHEGEPRERVDHGQDAQLAARRKLVMDEVQRPDIVRP